MGEIVACWPKQIVHRATKWDGDVEALNYVLDMTDEDWEFDPPQEGQSFVVESTSGDVRVSPGEWVVAQSGRYGHVLALNDEAFEFFFARPADTSWDD